MVWHAGIHNPSPVTFFAFEGATFGCPATIPYFLFRPSLCALLSYSHQGLLGQVCVLPNYASAFLVLVLCAMDDILSSHLKKTFWPHIFVGGEI
jgi:hypothetical protein